jgi:multidrug resistance efflux pump
MHQTRIYPAAALDDSVENLLATRRGGHGVIYWMLLLLGGALLVALPCVHVDIAVRAMGVVRPKLERTALSAPVEGHVKEIKVQDNQEVRRGEVLVVLESKVLEEKIAYNRAQQEELSGQLADLQLLSDEVALAGQFASGEQTVSGAAERVPAQRFRTANYLRQYDYYVGQLEANALQLAKARREFARVSALHERHLVTEQDHEQVKFALENAQTERQQLIRQNASRWQFDQLDKQTRHSSLVSEGQQLEKLKELYTICAPTDGTALGFTGFSVGSYVAAGTRLGEVSPSGALVVETVVLPKDIGFVHVGQAAKIQVDAFPHSQWGSLTGVVDSVSQDFIQAGTQPVFKARVVVERTSLHSAAGTAVHITKGMTVNARLLVTDRTLWQLIYQRVGDWLDPVAAKT